MQIHSEIIEYLQNVDATYASPQSSSKIGDVLKVNPSYVRLTIGDLLRKGKVHVRRGRGGGYYLSACR